MMGANENQPIRVKPGMSIVELGPAGIGKVFAHPAQRRNIEAVAALIRMLRACEEAEDFYDFQKQLFGHIYQAEERRAQCSRMIKRLRKGDPMPADAPPPPHNGDVARLEDWEFELFVYERITRQLRSVGDGLAWRCFGYDRRAILTLSRNASPGVMYGKDGLPYELGRIEQLWNDHGHFALHHDLTNCLRMGDLTEFTTDNQVWFREIKRKPHTDKKQTERLQRAVDAILHGNDLPGDRPDARLLQLKEPYITNFQQLDALLQLAKRHGCRGMKLPQGRAMVATSLVSAVQRWGTDHEEGLRVLNSVRQRAIQRAGMTTAMHHIRGTSGDTAARSEFCAPWSIYPFSPEDCAALICDLIVFETIISVDAVAASLEAVGVRTEVLLPAANGRVGGKAGTADVLRLHWRNRALTLHAAGLNLLLFELVEPQTWARGMLEVLSLPEPPSEPVFVFADEERVWYQPKG